MKVRGKRPSEFITGQLRGLAWTLGAVAGMREKARVLLFVLIGKRRRPGSRPEAFRMRALGGGRIWVRPATDDLPQAVYNYHGGLHLPPPEIAGEDLRQIVELGVNMGSAMAGLAYVVPERSAGRSRARPRQRRDRAAQPGPVR